MYCATRCIAIATLTNMVLKYILAVFSDGRYIVIKKTLVDLEMLSAGCVVDRNGLFLKHFVVSMLPTLRPAGMCCNKHVLC